jgi:hypothetical protein
LAERAAQTEQQGSALVALAHVVADAGGGGWPETMVRDQGEVQVPRQSGQAFRRDAGHRSELMSATIPI